MTWNDITLRQWNEIEKVFKEEYEDEILQTADLIKVVFDIDDPMSLTPQEFQQYVAKLEFLKTEIPERKLLNSYTINGTKYNFYGNCFDISMAQLMDWRHFSTKKPLDYSECLSIFLVPENHKYNDGYDMNKTTEDINSLPIGDVLKIWSFFREGLVLFMSTLTDYFKRQLKKTSLTTEQRTEIEMKMKELQEILDMTYSHTH